MSPYIMTFFITSLGLGTVITFASSHWLLAWMGLEINTLAILPIMIQPRHPRAVEATTKYFLTQATGAATLLFASSMNAWFTGQWNISLTTHPVPTALVILALSLKLGVAPLHSWLPEVLQALPLTTGLILSTWQKLAPISLLVQLPLENQPLLFVLGLTSMLVGGWGGMNHPQLRKVLAYSSIAHLGWMLLVLQLSPPLTLLALFIYLILTSALFLTFDYFDATTFKALATSSYKSPVLTGLLPMVILSLGGLPPFTGFLPKWVILNELVQEGLPLIATVAALTSLLSLHFYVRIAFNMMLVNPPNTVTATASWRLPPRKGSMFLAFTIVASITLLPMAPTFLALVTL